MSTKGFIWTDTWPLLSPPISESYSMCLLLPRSEIGFERPLKFCTASPDSCSPYFMSSASRSSISVYALLRRPFPVSSLDISAFRLENSRAPKSAGGAKFAPRRSIVPRLFELLFCLAGGIVTVVAYLLLELLLLVVFAAPRARRFVTLTVEVYMYGS